MDAGVFQNCTKVHHVTVLHLPVRDQIVWGTQDWAESLNSLSVALYPPWIDDQGSTNEVMAP